MIETNYSEQGETPFGLMQSPEEFQRIHKVQPMKGNSSSSYNDLSFCSESTRDSSDSCEGEGQGPMYISIFFANITIWLLPWGAI